MRTPAILTKLINNPAAGPATQPTQTADGRGLTQPSSQSADWGWTIENTGVPKRSRPGQTTIEVFSKFKLNFEIEIAAAE